MIRDSSSSESSEDDELDDKQKTDLLYVKKMIHSDTKVDNRLLKLF